ncbi:MAG: hypothetical protein KKC84_05730 [Candidatus Omnitrophica bacterium]|nr:hypothetical protein [Candidatus Omnitrophota bacterium]
MKKIAQRIILFAQKILITCVLFLLYVIGFGVMFLAAFMFRRELLGMPEKKKKSFWKDAEGYAASMEESLRSS